MPKIKLGEVVISPVAGLYIELKPSLLLEAKVSVEYTGAIEGCVGYSASPQDGFKKLKEEFDNPKIIVSRLGEKNIADAKISLPNLTYQKSDQLINPAVTYGNNILEEGVDYELAGDFSASEIGTYTVTICGIGCFAGSVDKTYQVYCSHDYGQWQTVKKPTTSATGSQERICAVCGNKESKTLARLSTNKQNNTTGYSKKKIKKPSKVTGLRVRTKKKKMVISWRWQIDISGFQIQYALNKGFTKKKTKNVGRYVDTKTIQGLKRKKTYYVRVRSFKKVSGKKVYGKWSGVKKVKIK